MKIEGDIAPGNVVWMTTTHPQYAGMRFQVWFIELTPPKRFVWEWHPGSVDEKVDYTSEPRTTVTFTLEPTQEGTWLSVSEAGFDKISAARRAKVYQENSGGWTEVIVWIQKYAEASR